MIPAGTQVLYKRFTMASREQIEYDGSLPQNCNITKAAIRLYFAVPSLPTITVDMLTSCNNGVNLTVLGSTFELVVTRGTRGGPHGILLYGW